MFTDSKERRREGGRKEGGERESHRCEKHGLVACHKHHSWGRMGQRSSKSSHLARAGSVF